LARTKSAAHTQAARNKSTIAVAPVPQTHGGDGASGLVTIFLLSATPLALVTGFFLSHDVIPKVVLLTVGAALLLFLLPQWSGRLTQLWRRPGCKWFLWLALAQAASLVVSAMFSPQPGIALVGTTWRRFGALEQLAVLLVAVSAAAEAVARPGWNRPGWTDWLLRGISLSGGIAAIYGISQYLGFDPFLARNLYAIDYLGGIVRPPATMGHAIYFAAWLVPVTLISGSLAGNDKAGAWRGIGAATALLAPVAIFLSGTRGSVLALLCAGAVLFSLGRASMGRLPMKAFGAAAGLVLLAVVALVISPAGTSLRHRLTQWKEDPGTVRLGVWREAPALIAEHPLLGSGPDTFGTAFRAIESPAFSRGYPDFIHETPHNALIDAACAQGLPGTLILAGVFLLGLRAKGQTALRAALAGMLVGSLFASFTLVTSMFVWVLTGLLVAGESGGTDLGTDDPVTDDAMPQWVQVPAVLLGGVFLSFALLLAVQDAAYARLGDAVEAKDSGRAMRALDTATGFGIGLPGYELWGSREMATLGRVLGDTPEGATLSKAAWGKAAEAAALAERRGEDRASAAYQSSVLAIAAADVTRGEASARDAIALAPNWYKPHLLRGQILQAMGRNDEAAREMQISAGLGWRGK